MFTWQCSFFMPEINLRQLNKRLSEFNSEEHKALLADLDRRNKAIQDRTAQTKGNIRN